VKMWALRPSKFDLLWTANAPDATIGTACGEAGAPKDGVNFLGHESCRRARSDDNAPASRGDFRVGLGRRGQARQF